MEGRRGEGGHRGGGGRRNDPCPDGRERRRPELHLAAFRGGPGRSYPVPRPRVGARGIRPLGEGQGEAQGRRDGSRAGELRLRPGGRGARLRKRSERNLLVPVRHPGDEGVPEIKGTLPRIFIAATLVLLLPLAGAAALGKSLAPYLQFPPKTPDVPHVPFSLPVFLVLTLLILAATAPLLLRLVSFRPKEESREPVVPFPKWGWAGAILGVASWILAWTRFPWMSDFQAHMFTPLWIAFILLVNAFTVRRTGRCLMLSRTRPFLLLFPVSAGFWWSFEYLNRFVGNWRYAGVAGFGAVEYFLFATLPFSTVLPAVLSTRELLLSCPRIEGAFREWRPLSPGHPVAI